MAKNIIIDTSGRVDDLLALALAQNLAEINLLGVTGVFGVAEPGRACRWLHLICEYTGISAPAAFGAHKGILDYHHSKNVYLANEIAWPVGAVIPTGQRENEHAVALLQRLIAGSDAPVSVVALGPLTNIAILLAAHPELHEKIDSIVFVGGAGFGGDALASVERNLLLDPEAGYMVFASGVRIKMIGLDIEDDAKIHFYDAPKFYDAETQAASVVYNNMEAGERVSLRPAAAVAMLAEPGVLELEDQYVEVDLVGRFTRGATFADKMMTYGKEANADVAIGIDSEKVFQMALAAIAKTPM